MPLYGHIGPRRLVRTFVAIPTPDDIVRRLLKLTQQFQWPGCKLRWSAAEQLHLTVQFLGNVEWIEIGKIGKTLKEVAAEFPPLTLQLSHLTVFPPRNQPRVVVAALEPNPTLLELVETLQEALRDDHQIVPEKRQYRPHITLGRVKSVVDAEAGEVLRADLAAVDTALLQSWGEWEADELTFFQSDLDGGRPEYIELSHAALAAPREDDDKPSAEPDAADGAARPSKSVGDRSVAALIARSADREKTRHQLAFHEEVPADAEFEIDLDASDDDDDSDADEEGDSTDPA